MDNNHPSSPVPRNYRNTTVTDPQSPVNHIIAHKPNIEDIYEEIKEQPHITSFRSQSSHLFSPRWAARLDPSTVPFLTHPISNVILLIYQSLISLPLPYHHTLIIHYAWILIIIPHAQFFIPSHSLTIPKIKLQMKSRIPSPARPLFCNPPSNRSTHQLPMNLAQPLLPSPTQPQSSPQWTATNPTGLTPSMKNQKTSLIISSSDNNSFKTLTD